MRRRLVVSTLVIVAIVLVLLTVPVALILRRAATNELRVRTAQEAEAVAALIETDLAADREIDLTSAARMIRPGDSIRVLGPDGEVLAEHMAETSTSTLVSSVDGPDGTVIEVAADRASIQRKLRNQLRTLGAVAVVAVLAAVGLALWGARRLAQPLEQLSRSAVRLGEGDFSAAATPPTGIREIDNIARAIRLSANRVRRMLESERGFTADATHQLRTGLTGLSVRLELLARHEDPEVGHEAEALLTQIHDLNSALDELLVVARKGSTGERRRIDLTALVRDHVADWQARFAAERRDIVVTTLAERDAVATPGLIGQILNVLFENALVHGDGTVTVSVRECVVTIGDEGGGVTAAQAASLFDRPADHHTAHGRGLPLARRLAESDGGHLELAGLRPAVFRLTLLGAEIADDDSPSSVARDERSGGDLVGQQPEHAVQVMDRARLSEVVDADGHRARSEDTAEPGEVV